MTATQWLRALTPDNPTPVWTATYGGDPAVVAERLRLVRCVTGQHLDRFDDGPLQIFRCPGRINLRGMHVDTHGGYLNLMTHQREVLFAVSPTDDDNVVIANSDHAFSEMTFHVEDLVQNRIQGDWLQFIMQPRVRQEVEAMRGHWSHYVKGAFLSVRHRFPQAKLRGVRGVIAGDIPRGASLSSSAALCICLVKALLALNELELANADLAQAAREAEWYTGSRCGLGDQAAMVLGGVDEMVNLALDPARPDMEGVRRLRFPEDLAILVINSYTERSLSGAAGVDYTRNRFAYGMALEILRQEMARQGLPANAVEKARTLSALSPVEFEPFGGCEFILRLLSQIPDEMSVDELRARYDLPQLNVLYDQYFGSAPPDLRPSSVALRGPLLFGIAESERARVFIDALAQGDYARAGRLMTVGHDGDRRVWRTPPDADGRSLEMLPGAYGASSPVLDALVDVALDAGALGASLTGAGMAGTVLALCSKEDAARVGEAVKQWMSRTDYAMLARRTAPLSPEDLANAVVINSATAAPGELELAV